MTSEQQQVVQLPAGKDGSQPKELTKMSPDERLEKITIELAIDENDVRARQFACHLVIHNGTANSVDVLAINHRLGFGVSVEKSENTSSIDLKEEYDSLRRDVKGILRLIYITNSEEYRANFSKNLLDSLREQFRYRNLALIYFYLLTFRFKTYVRNFTQVLGRMDFPITTAVDAKEILQGLIDKKVIPVVSDLLAAKIKRMAAIEQMDQNFLRPEYVTQIVPSEHFERIYILEASRKFSSIASYTAAFDVKLGWDEQTPSATPRHVERTMSRSTSFDVTPSPAALSVFAMLFSFLGALLNSIPQLKDNYHALFEIEYEKKYFVAAVLALVLYNSLEMTDLKERVRSISWRSAMFIGMLCGLLSNKMLEAITGFVK